ncbi:EEF1A lysine methyltransferase 4-like [Acropora muricata]|uniref:EEF1A lysine methyltransferase 4-like n=1 Tax=Acropora muricata TaxID=159855 RepID=UPI0034E4B529
MNLPDSNSSYKIKEYWDERFSEEDSFEWCKGYSDFKDLLYKHVRKVDRILMLGCGNSRLSEDMYNDGFKNITNIDYSPVVIEKMRKKCRGLAEMQWLVMDITKLNFDRSSFDVILEKATLDALLVEETNPWNLSENTWNTMDSVLSKVSQILVTGGCFISITFSQPHFRKPILAKAQYDWSVSTSTYGNSFHFFFYVMKKGQQLNEDDKLLELTVKNKREHSNDWMENNHHLQEKCMAEDSEDFLCNVTL